MLIEDIENRFTHHSPKMGQAEKYQCLRDAVKEVAHLMNGICIESREKSLAICHLEEAVFWANASIARNEK